MDPVSFLQPVIETSSVKDDIDYELVDPQVKMENDDDDDDDDGIDDGRYSIGYYPHAASLLVSKTFSQMLKGNFPACTPRFLSAMSQWFGEADVISFILFFIWCVQEKSSDDDKGDAGDSDQQGSSNPDGLEMQDGK